jgi:hypothetical protein
MAKQKITIEKLAEMSQQEFLDIKKSMAAGFADVHSDIKLVLSAIENLSGQITDVKQTTRNAFDYALLEGRVEALEKQMEKTHHCSCARPPCADPARTRTARTLWRLLLVGIGRWYRGGSILPRALWPSSPVAIPHAYSRGARSCADSGGGHPRAPLAYLLP